jgi:hypothetical protein
MKFWSLLVIFVAIVHFSTLPPEPYYSDMRDYAPSEKMTSADNVVYKFVDLDEPGALAHIAANDPWRLAKIAATLDGFRFFGSVDKKPFKTGFQAEEVYVSPIMLPTDPPKSDVSFVIGNTRYFKRHTWDPAKGRAHNGAP